MFLLAAVITTGMHARVLVVRSSVNKHVYINMVTTTGMHAHVLVVRVIVNANVCKNRYIHMSF